MPKITGSDQYKFTFADRAKGNANRMKEKYEILEYIVNGCIDELDSKTVMDYNSWDSLNKILDIKDDIEDYGEAFNEFDKKEQKRYGSIRDKTNWVKIAMAAICSSSARNWLKNIETYLDPKYRGKNLDTIRK